MIRHASADATDKAAAWQVLLLFPSSFQQFAAELAASVGSTCFIFIADMAPGSAGLSLGFPDFVFTLAHITPQPQAPGDICSPQIGLNKFQVRLLKALFLGEYQGSCLQPFVHSAGVPSHRW